MARFFKPYLFLFGGCSSYLSRCDIDLFNTKKKKLFCEEQSTLKFALIFFSNGSKTPSLNEYVIKGVIWPKECVEEHPCSKIDCQIINSIRRPHLNHSKIDDMADNSGKLEGGAPKGRLTINGQNDSINLGKKLKKIYIDQHKLVGDFFKNSEVSLYSIYTQANLSSLKCLLSGMFNLTETEKPIIYSRLNEHEIYFPNFPFCYRYTLFYRTAVELEDQITRFNLYRRKVAEKLGCSVEELPHPCDLREELCCLRGNNFEIPEIFENSFDYISMVAAKFYEYRAHESRRIFKQLSCGFVYNNIYDYMAKNILREESQSLYLFSVPETTLMSLMKVLDVFDPKWPDLPSYLSYELHQINNAFFVRIVFNDKVIDLPNSENGMLFLKKFEKLAEPMRIHGFTFLDVCMRGPAQGYFDE